MCGRFVAYAEREQLAQQFHATRQVGEPVPANFNTAPTQTIDAILERADNGAAARQIRGVRWGLVPSWSRGIRGAPLANARVETAASRPSFRSAWRMRRCILPAAGYIEWETVAAQGRIVKQPWYIHPADDTTLAFAGLYELWPDPAKPVDDPARWLWSATILTAEATGPAGEIHDRTPLILPPERIDRWLAPNITDPDAVTDLVTGIALTPLLIRPVSTTVNNARNRGGPELIAPLPDETEKPLPLLMA
ncbi:MAG: SOS response-associated peptidase [Frankiaceae bacterium]|jgi:putative SOS response-associated peptidase YedK|nr:SOS response-associated peptidase [Frankiaceae bacterium]